MKVSARDLRVAEAAYNYCSPRYANDQEIVKNALVRVIEALDEPEGEATQPNAVPWQPQPEPLPAPTGPGFWWARMIDDEGGGWVAVEVVEREIRHERGDHPELRVWATGATDEMLVGDFDAWLPLTPPEVTK